MLDKDLADLYGTETKFIKRAVKRNLNRFPSDFMFELSKEEFANLRYQFGTSSWGAVVTYLMLLLSMAQSCLPVSSTRKLPCKPAFMW